MDVPGRACTSIDKSRIVSSSEGPDAVYERESLINRRKDGTPRKWDIEEFKQVCLPKVMYDLYNKCAKFSKAILASDVDLRIRHCAMEIKDTYPSRPPKIHFATGWYIPFLPRSPLLSVFAPAHIGGNFGSSLS